MSTEQIFNRNVHGLWRQMTDFAMKNNVTMIQNDSAVTLNLKGVKGDVSIGQVECTEPNRFLYSYRQKDGGVVSFAYTSQEIPMFLRTLQRNVDTALDPRSTYNKNANLDLTDASARNGKLMSPDFEITIALNDNGGFTLREYGPGRPFTPQTQAQPGTPNTPR